MLLVTGEESQWFCWSIVLVLDWNLLLVTGEESSVDYKKGASVFVSVYQSDQIIASTHTKLTKLKRASQLPPVPALTPLLTPLILYSTILYE